MTSGQPLVITGMVNEIVSEPWTMDYVKTVAGERTNKVSSPRNSMA